MLLFNYLVVVILWRGILFQNISCYCLTRWLFPGRCQTNEFQNISCYCLTIVETDENEKEVVFQNISCYCLTLQLFRSARHTIISKHLMLLFNSLKPWTVSLASTFQNISCYCLTIFPTFHRSTLYIFQNISCYCLTKENIHCFSNQIIFQNISCYCLTNEKSLFLNRFFYKKERFYKLFQYFYQPTY